MKSFIKLLGIIALTAVIGFTLITCGNNGGGGGGGDSDPGGKPENPKPFNNITASQLVANIKIGWNLGNTLDASGLFWLPDNAPVSDLETAWGNSVTTKANITAVKNAGFNAIRIPVSWTKAADANYNIRADWMARVIEIVDYAVENDMYILLNTHHEEEVFKFTDVQKAQSLAAFKKIWEQIADAFKNYNEKLVFEALNEPRTIGAAHEWVGGNDEERANLNEHYKVFVETVRASGGNNDKRILMINTYAASKEAVAMDGLVIPSDSASNKIIVSFHAYEPFDFAHEPSGTNTWDSLNPPDTEAITIPIDNFCGKFVNAGIPVIIGEFAALNKNNLSSRVEWADFFISYATSKGIKCFWWDPGKDPTDVGEMSVLNRNDNTFPIPELIAALIKG